MNPERHATQPRPVAGLSPTRLTTIDALSFSPAVGQIAHIRYDGETLALLISDEFVKGTRRSVCHRVVDRSCNGSHLCLGHHVIHMFHPGTSVRGDAGTDSQSGCSTRPSDGSAPFLDVLDLIR